MIWMPMNGYTLTGKNYNYSYNDNSITVISNETI